MGKNLKGKECGKGICQRKDGKYTARYSAEDGKRREKHFNTLLEAGLRTSELIGLTWDAVNWEKHTLTVNKTLEYRHRAIDGLDPLNQRKATARFP